MKDVIYGWLAPLQIPRKVGQILIVLQCAVKKKLRVFYSAGIGRLVNNSDLRTVLVRSGLFRSDWKACELLIFAYAHFCPKNASRFLPFKSNRDRRSRSISAIFLWANRQSRCSNRALCSNNTTLSRIRVRRYGRKWKRWANPGLASLEYRRAGQL